MGMDLGISNFSKGESMPTRSAAIFTTSRSVVFEEKN